MKLVVQVSAVFEYQKQKIAFIYTIIEMFRDIIMDIHEFGKIQCLTKYYFCLYIDVIIKRSVHCPCELIFIVR